MSWKGRKPGRRRAVSFPQSSPPQHISPDTNHGGRPTFVPGLHWLGLCCYRKSPNGCHAVVDHWEPAPPSYRGVPCSTVCARLGPRVLHAWDRGFAGDPGSLVLDYRLRFVLWCYHLLDDQAKAPRLADCDGSVRGFLRCWDIRQQWRKTVPRHAGQAPGTPTTTVVSGFPSTKERPPWYLLTTTPSSALTMLGASSWPMADVGRSR